MADKQLEASRTAVHSLRHIVRLTWASGDRTKLVANGMKSEVIRRYQLDNRNTPKGSKSEKVSKIEFLDEKGAVIDEHLYSPYEW